LTEQNDVRETPAEREAWLDRIARDDQHDPPRQSSGVIHEAPESRTRLKAMLRAAGVCGDVTVSLDHESAPAATDWHGRRRDGLFWSFGYPHR
jgi:hypothetical protein